MPAPTKLSALLLPVAVAAACGSPGPTVRPFHEDGPIARPTVYGEGDCLVEVRNLTTRPMDLHYYSGMRAPSPTWFLWPSLGQVEPRAAVRARVPCEDGRVRVRAWHRGRHPADPPEDWLASAEGWVEEGEVALLYLRADAGG